MSLTSALNSAVSGLAVNQRGLEIASHNIGNANTEGYSRRVMRTESVDSLGIGSRGVTVSNIERVTDKFLSQQVRTESSTLGRAEVRDRYLTNTQDLFGNISSDSSIGQRIADMMNRMEVLAVEPESATAASALIDDAVRFATDLNAISDKIETQRLEADLEIARSIEDLNTDLQLVADVNDKIVSLNVSGGAEADSGDLLDRRDMALKRIGEKINIKTFERSNGEVVVYTGDSRPLLDGDPVKIVYSPSGSGALGTAYETIATADGISLQSDIRDGSIKGLLELRDKVLPNLYRQMDTLAANARDVANAAHNRGMGFPAAPTLTGSRDFADSATDQVTVGSDVRFVVTGASGLTVAAFDLPAGVYTIDDVATAIDAGLGADGSASVVGGKLVVSAAVQTNGVGLVDLNGGADAAISFDDGTGAKAFKGFSNFFGLNDFLQTPGALEGDGTDGVSGAIRVRADLVSDPARLARGRVTMAATAPVAGVDRAIAVGDGSVMAGMAAAFAAARSIPAVGGLPPINKPLFEFASEIMGLNSQLGRDESERLAFQQALVEQFEGRLLDKSGVSLDEELANILMLQNAFSASARVVTTADEMMDIITNMKR